MLLSCGAAGFGLLGETPFGLWVYVRSPALGAALGNAPVLRYFVEARPR